MERSQRERLLIAAAHAVADKGYTATSVADILKIAGVSRTTFYQLYEDKLDCFLAACRMAADVLVEVIVDRLDEAGDAAGAGTDDRLAAIDRLLGAYLDTLVANPVLARVFLVEVYAAGPRAIAQRRESLDGFIDVIVSFLSAREGAPAGPDPRFAAEVLAGAVSSLVTTAVGTGDVGGLPDLREPLMEIVARFLD